MFKLEMSDPRHVMAVTRQEVRGMTLALLEQQGLVGEDKGNEFRGFTVHDAMDRCAKAAGNVSPNCKGRREDFVFAMTRSDFPMIMGNVVHAALMAGWESARPTSLRFMNRVDVKDFRETDVVAVGGLEDLAKVGEGESFPGGNFYEFAQKVSVLRHGRIVYLTREMLTDGNIFPAMSAARGLGVASAAAINAAAYAKLHENPVLSDGGALFNVQATSSAGGHANLATTPSALGAVSLGLGKAALMRQSARVGGRPLGVRARFLAVSPENEDVAWALCGVPGGFGDSGSDVERYMLNAGRLEILSDPELQGNEWFLFASPEVLPILRVAYVNGTDQPVLDVERPFDSDAVRMRVGFSFGICVGDWRGGYRNDGA